MDVVLDMLLTQPIGLLSLFTILFIVFVHRRHRLFHVSLGHAQNEHPRSMMTFATRSTP